MRCEVRGVRFNFINLLSSMNESMCLGSFGSIHASQSVVSQASEVSTAAAAADAAAA